MSTKESGILLQLKDELKSIHTIEKYYVVKADKVQLHSENWIQCCMYIFSHNHAY